MGEYKVATQMVAPDIVHVEAEWKIIGFAKIQDFFTFSERLYGSVIFHETSNTKFQLSLLKSPNDDSYYGSFTLGIAIADAVPADPPRKGTQAVAFHAFLRNRKGVDVSLFVKQHLDLAVNGEGKGLRFSKRLLKKANNLLQDGSLHIIAHIWFVQRHLCDVKSSIIVQGNLSDKQLCLVEEESIKSFCANLLASGRFSDLTLTAFLDGDDPKEQDRKCFAVHKFVLAYASPVFGKQLEHADVRHLEIKGFRGAVVKEMLNFIYGQPLDVGSFSVTMATDLLRLAEKFEIKDLVEICKGRLHELATGSALLSASALSKTPSLDAAQRVSEWLHELAGEAANVERCKKYLEASNGNSATGSLIGPGGKAVGTPANDSLIARLKRRLAKLLSRGSNK